VAIATKIHKLDDFNVDAKKPMQSFVQSKF